MKNKLTALLAAAALAASLTSCAANEPYDRAYVTSVGIDYNNGFTVTALCAGEGGEASCFSGEGTTLEHAFRDIHGSADKEMFFKRCEVVIMGEGTSRHIALTAAFIKENGELPVGAKLSLCEGDAKALLEEIDDPALPDRLLTEKNGRNCVVRIYEASRELNLGSGWLLAPTLKKDDEGSYETGYLLAGSGETLELDPKTADGLLLLTNRLKKAVLGETALSDISCGIYFEKAVSGIKLVVEISAFRVGGGDKISAENEINAMTRAALSALPSEAVADILGVYRAADAAGVGEISEGSGELERLLLGAEVRAVVF